MSIFSKIGKAVKKALPAIATVAQFIPATAPFAAAYNVAQAARKKDILGVVGGIAGLGGVGGALGKVGKIAGKVAKVGSVIAPAIARPTMRIPSTPLASQANPFTITLPPVAYGEVTGVSGMSIAGGMLPAVVGAAGRVLPGIGRAVGGAAGRVVGTGRALAQRFPRSAKALRDLGLFTAGGLIYDQAGNIVGRRAPARRINPMNAKAARRAARRIKAAHKLCKTIESCLPRRSAPRACAPSFVGGGRRRRKC